ncbi:MAG: hypothetical protein II430_02980 [Selenomonas sp.]|nr:hypothetical protein [Selenomonas sp.]
MDYRNHFTSRAIKAIEFAQYAAQDLTAAFDRLNKYFTISEMPIASSRYWNMVHGHTPEDVMKDEEGVQIMRILGRNMAFLIRAIAAERERNGLPEREVVKYTNFIR